MTVKSQNFAEDIRQKQCSDEKRQNFKFESNADVHYESLKENTTYNQQLFTYRW